MKLEIDPIILIAWNRYVKSLIYTLSNYVTKLI